MGSVVDCHAIPTRETQNTPEVNGVRRREREWRTSLRGSITWCCLPLYRKKTHNIQKYDHGGCLSHKFEKAKSSGNTNTQNVKRESSRTRGLVSERKNLFCLLDSSSLRYRFLSPPTEVAGSNLLFRSVRELNRLGEFRLGNIAGPSNGYARRNFSDSYRLE